VFEECPFSSGVDTPTGRHTLAACAEALPFSPIIKESPACVSADRVEQMVIRCVEIGVIVFVKHDWLTLVGVDYSALVNQSADLVRTLKVVPVSGDRPMTAVAATRTIANFRSLP
jgi:hypothetical protein